MYMYVFRYATLYECMYVRMCKCKYVRVNEVCLCSYVWLGRYARYARFVPCVTMYVCHAFVCAYIRCVQ
jgi:hypothetical protein